MLRNVLSCTSRRIYTCLFVPLKTRHPAAALQVATTQSFHTSLDYRDRAKRLSERSQAKHQDVQAQKADKLKDLKFTTLAEENFDAAFPTEDTPDMMIQGTKYKDLPVVHIKASANNFRITLSSAEGKTVKTATGGSVGFKNKRESTAVAAQVATVAIAKEAKREGMYAVRVALNGIGLGREAGLKALVTAGISVVSITDVTPTPFNGNRPQKRRSM
ncbi:small ribosomal subunit protein uS11-like [Ylistrum balloti]|uniref:small ribosomal subunit protein uS11-like n=1 Tax=Ylistrum balloti TaxID=509963 RepID=UPI002905DE52|nr:small ribosomal subunit protein uS11-like [Ylistrum balloti]